MGNTERYEQSEIDAVIARERIGSGNWPGLLGVIIEAEQDKGGE